VVSRVKVGGGNGQGNETGTEKRKRGGALRRGKGKKGGGNAWSSEFRKEAHKTLVLETLESKKKEEKEKENLRRGAKVRSKTSSKNGMGF